MQYKEGTPIATDPKIMRGDPIGPLEDKPVWQRPSFAGGRDPIKPSHYTRHKIEPWDYVAANELGYFEGSAIKYLTRWRYKNGVVDLQKARAFIDKLIAIEEKKMERQVGMVPELGMGYTGGAEPEPWDIYGKLVRDTGEQVGGQPAPEDAERGTDRGGRAK